MSPTRVIAAFSVIGLAAGLVWYFQHDPPSPPAGPPASEGPQEQQRLESPYLPVPDQDTRQGPTKDTLAGRAGYDTGIPNDPRVRHTDDGRHVFLECIGMAKRLHAAGETSEQDLELLSGVLSFYRASFDENPVAADNQSVMAALMGDNPRSLVFFPGEHPSLNEQNELTDRWGEPYYFHPLSGKQMEIISTGPDRKLGTDDDLIHTQRDQEQFFRGFTDAPPDPTEDE